MPFVEVLDTGPLTTIQDAGRFGLRDFGVSQAGPMDQLAFEMSNLLVGNVKSAAAFEFALNGGRFRFDANTAVAVTGPGVELSTDGAAMATNQTLKIDAGQILCIGPVRNGLWGYLAVAGGINTQPVLGSRATHLRFGLGGLAGRSLVGGDRVPVASTDGSPPVRIAEQDLPKNDQTPIRVILGPQDDYFHPDMIAQFLSTTFRVSTRVDRMASILDGAPLIATRGHDIISDATIPGVIQVPASGQPLILMAEGQTTGGYPKIATIIGADLRRVAQTAPGKNLSFVAVAPEEAEAALFGYRNQHHKILKSVCPAKFGQICNAQLYSTNLISGVWGSNTGKE